MYEKLYKKNAGQVRMFKTNRGNTSWKYIEVQSLYAFHNFHITQTIPGITFEIFIAKMTDQNMFVKI